MKRRNTNNPSNRTLPLLMIIGGVVIIIIAVVVVLANAPTTSAPQLSGSIGTPFPDVARVSVAEAKQAYDSQSALIVDVRDSGSYAAGHVAGALNIPLDQIENRLDELPKDRWIITYCT